MILSQESSSEQKKRCAIGSSIAGDGVMVRRYAHVETFRSTRWAQVPSFPACPPYLAVKHPWYPSAAGRFPTVRKGRLPRRRTRQITPSRRRCLQRNRTSDGAIVVAVLGSRLASPIFAQAITRLHYDAEYPENAGSSQPRSASLPTWIGRFRHPNRVREWRRVLSDVAERMLSAAPSPGNAPRLRFITCAVCQVG